jgi:hypothetical protein
MSRLWRTGRSVRHFYRGITGDRADFGVNHPEDSCFPAEPQLELRTRSLWRMQHDPVSFKHQELRAGKSEAMLDKEDPPSGIILTFRQQFSGTPFIHSDNAAGRKVWKRVHVSFADFAIEKSYLA